MKKLICTSLALLCASFPVWADDKAKLMDELSGYLEFADYGGGTIFAEQIPKGEYARMMVIDARDAAQYAKEHIPRAHNIEWRQVLAKSGDIPKKTCTDILQQRQSVSPSWFCPARLRLGKRQNHPRWL